MRTLILASRGWKWELWCVVLHEHARWQKQYHLMSDLSAKAAVISTPIIVWEQHVLQSCSMLSYDTSLFCQRCKVTISPVQTSTLKSPQLLDMPIEKRTGIRCNRASRKENSTQPTSTSTTLSTPHKASVRTSNMSTPPGKFYKLKLPKGMGKDLHENNDMIFRSLRKRNQNLLFWMEICLISSNDWTAGLDFI